MLGPSAVGLRAPRLTPTFVNSPDNRCVAQRNAHLTHVAPAGGERRGARGWSAAEHLQMGHVDAGFGSRRPSAVTITAQLGFGAPDVVGERLQ